MIDYDLQQDLSSFLNPGERLLWAGKPKRGILFKSGDIIMIPFSLLWGGFAFFWETIAIMANTPLFFKLFGIPFVVAGFYLIVGRFFVDANKRAKTIYGLTKDRIIIKTGNTEQSVQSLFIQSLPDMTLDLRKDGSGSIAFGLGSAMGLSVKGSNMYGKQLGSGIELIYDVRYVYDKIVELQKHNGQPAV